MATPSLTAGTEPSTKKTAQVSPNDHSLFLLGENASSDKNLFLIHAHGGLLVWYSALAKELGREVNVFGLQSKGLAPGSRILNSIEEMAESYLAEITQLQSTGPYLLGGHCMGGTIAWEIASQLRSNGHEVSWLGMFQSFHRDMPYPFPQGEGAAYSQDVGIVKNIQLIWDRLWYLSLIHI